MQVNINSTAAPYENLLTNLSLVPDDLASRIDPETGSFLMNGEWISPGAVRELDEWTGAQHYQYATPGGVPENANIWTIKPGGAVFLGSDGKAAEVQPAAPAWLPSMGLDWTPICAAVSAEPPGVDEAAVPTETAGMVETSMPREAAAVVQASIEPEVSASSETENSSSEQLRLDLEIAVLQQQASAGIENTIADRSLLEYL